MHWVAISSYSCDQGEIYLMDSLFNGRIAEHTKKQICSILNCAAGKIKVNVLPVQQQSNGVDCEIYALAFCFYILSKRTNPINVFFYQGKLKSHLLHCLTANKMTHFPMLQTATKTCVAKTVTINVFCSCRMPWKKSENSVYERQMVECSDCSEWFHRMCDRIPHAVFRKKNSKCDWLCYQCSSKRAKTTCT